MKAFPSVAALAALLIGACVVVGCSSNNQQPSSENTGSNPNPAMGGGNGTMGESPAHAGSYNNGAPATQPAGY